GSGAWGRRAGERRPVGPTPTGTPRASCPSRSEPRPGRCARPRWLATRLAGPRWAPRTSRRTTPWWRGRRVRGRHPCFHLPPGHRQRRSVALVVPALRGLWVLTAAAETSLGASTPDEGVGVDTGQVRLTDFWQRMEHHL